MLSQTARSVVEIPYWLNSTVYYYSIGGGTTWHSAALTVTLREHAAQGGLHAYGVELYKKLEDQGYGTGMYLSHVL